MQAAAEHLKQVELILHAGDVGNHGAHREVLEHFATATGAPLLAVAGNVDDKLTSEGRQLLPDHRLLTVAGWRILLTHIVAPGPQAKVDSAAATLIQQLQPNIVVFGHSHKAGCWCKDGIYYINPGSAGPARFNLRRTVARLLLSCTGPQHNTGRATDASVMWATSDTKSAASRAPDGKAQLSASPRIDNAVGHQMQQTGQAAVAAAAAAAAALKGRLQGATIAAKTQSHAGCVTYRTLRSRRNVTESDSKECCLGLRQSAAGVQKHSCQAGHSESVVAHKQASTCMVTNLSASDAEQKADTSVHLSWNKGGAAGPASNVHVVKLGRVHVEFYQLPAKAPQRLSACSSMTH